MKLSLSKNTIAALVAVIFHTVGLAGILIFKSDWIIRSTPFNLLLCVALIIWTQESRNVYFWLFLLATVVSGFVVEVIGVNTGLLFGKYQYGTVLGAKWMQVPLIIGVNWFIVMYCSGISITALLQKIIQPDSTEKVKPPAFLKSIAVITDSATLAVAFDWLIEPVAVKLGFWQWQNNEIPLFNYTCWFLISLLLMWLFKVCRFSKANKFAIHLLLIQVMFFLILRTFLP